MAENGWRFLLLKTRDKPESEHKNCRACVNTAETAYFAAHDAQFALFTREQAGIRKITR